MDAQRYELLDDRIDHVNERCDSLNDRLVLLESDKELKKARTLEWVVIVLILVEIVESIPVWHYFHG